MSEDLVSEYSRQVRVPIYDVGPRHLLKLGTVLRYVQETSEQHLGVLHISYEELRRQAGLVFFIISTRAKLHRLPTHNELVTIKTHPRGRAGVQFYRDFKFYSQSGELMIDVMQTTALVDITTHKAQRPQNLYRLGIFKDFPVEPEEKMARISFPGELPLVGERRVYESDLDSNGHMNNSIYGDVVADFLPPLQNREIAQMQITYQSEMPLGETLAIYAGEENGRVLMKGVGPKGDSFSASVLLREQKTLEPAFER